MAGCENLGVICYSNPVLHGLGNCKEVHDSLLTHSDMHTIPGIYAIMFQALFVYVVKIGNRHVAL